METLLQPNVVPLREMLESRLDDGEIKLPVLPVVATQVIAMANNDDIDLSDLSQLIHKDQALAGHVLRIANSVLFAGNTAIVSLQQAIARLGVNMIGEMATVISIQGQVFKAKGFGKEIDQVWKHALLSGFYGKEIARAMRKNVEAQFLCGLLHTIGKPILFQTISDIQEEKGLIPQNEANIPQLIDLLHPRTGQLACEKWKLPRQVQACCSFYLNRDKTSEFQDSVAMTYLGSRLAEWCLDGSELSIDTLRQEPVFTELNFYPDEVDALLEKRETVLNLMETMVQA